MSTPEKKDGPNYDGPEYDMDDIFASVEQSDGSFVDALKEPPPDKDGDA